MTFLGRGNPGALLRPPGATGCCKNSVQSRTEALLLSIGSNSLEHIEVVVVKLGFFEALRGKKMQTAPHETVVVAIGAYSIERIEEMSKLPGREPLLLALLLARVTDWALMILRRRELQNGPK